MTVQQRWMLVAAACAIGISLHFLSPILAPFITSMVLAYLGDALVDRMEKIGLSRNCAVTIVFVVILLAIFIMLLIIIPLIFQQLKTLIQLLPTLEAWLSTNIWPIVQEYLDIDPRIFDLSDMAKNMANEWKKSGGSIANLGISVTKSSIAMVGFLVNLFLVPVVTFYLLRDWDKMTKSLRVMIPRNVETIVVNIATECDNVLAAFLKGQLMVMLSLGIIYSSGLTLLGLKFSVLIGLLAGLASIIPYMGFFIGIATAIIVALFQFNEIWPVVAVAAVFIAGQALEGWALTPSLVGDKIGLHPVAVIFSLMAGGELFGVVGMLLALPIAAIIMVLLRYIHLNYRESHLYHAKFHE